MTRTTVLVLALSLSFACATPVGIARADEAEDLWLDYCVSCHGNAGKGNGPAAVSLKTKPADLSDCEKMGEVSDEKVAKVIAEGGKANDLSDDMASYSDRLDAEQIDLLVEYIRGFCD